jgi:hypothetical protein
MDRGAPGLVTRSGRRDDRQGGEIVAAVFFLIRSEEEVDGEPV